MRRREFITLVTSAAAFGPSALHAQQPTMPVIGFLGPGSSESDAYRVTSFQQGLKETGFVDKQNVLIEYRWAQSHYDQLHKLAGELVQTKVAVIATSGTPAALAAKAATTTVPIVFETAADPVQIGLVASLNRPGGNVTGIAQAAEEAAPKRLELLHELIPQHV
jgi:putative tryptophan/tyrosine transport system substrate-binding protein